MRSLLLGLVLILTLATQVVIWPDLTLAFQPAILLALAAAWGFATTMRKGFTIGLVGAAILDLYSGHHFGMFMLAHLVGMSILLLYAITRPGELTGPVQLTLFLVAAAAYELVLLTITSITNGPYPFFAALLTTATLNVLVSGLVFAILAPAVRRLRQSISPYDSRPLRH